MIVHCTKKLAAKFPNVTSEPQTETSPLGSWHANLYTFDRRQCVLFTHDETRYSLFLTGVVKPMFENMDEFFKGMFLGSLFSIGVPDNKLKRVELALGKMTFDSNTDRSVLGSMTNLKHMIHARVVEVENVMDLDLLELNHWLTNIPRKSLAHPNFGWPQREMKALVATL